MGSGLGVGWFTAKGNSVALSTRESGKATAATGKPGTLDSGLDSEAKSPCCLLTLVCQNSLWGPFLGTCASTFKQALAQIALPMQEEA